MKNHIDLHVRLPRDLHKEVWRLADLHGYSLNTEFVVLLRKYIHAEHETTTAIPGEIKNDIRDLGQDT